MSRANFGTSTDITLTAKSGSLPTGANARGVTSSLRTSLPKHNKLGVACEFLPRASEKCALCHPHLTARLSTPNASAVAQSIWKKVHHARCDLCGNAIEHKNRTSVWDCMCQVYVSGRQKKKNNKLCHTSSPFERKRLSKKSPELLSRAVHCPSPGQ